MVLLYTGRLKTNKNPAENQDIHMDFKIVIKKSTKPKVFCPTYGNTKQKSKILGKKCIC